MKRRAFLTGVGGVAAAGLAANLVLSEQEGSLRSAVMIAEAPSYRANLVAIIRSGLNELGIEPGDIRGKSVLLKPNLVEPCARGAAGQYPPGGRARGRPRSSAAGGPGG